MTTFMQRSTRHFLMIKAVREIKGEIEKAGLDNLKMLAEAGVSIIGTYLNGCSPEEQARIRRDFNALLQLGVTPEMVLSEVIRQMPKLAPIIEGKEGYKKSDIQKLETFLKEGQ
ncbi:hypothetical protein ES707_03659 [subsurface metagenome]